MRGRDLRSLREEAGLYRYELAELIKCKPGYLRNVECAYDEPSAVVAHRLTRVLTERLGRVITLDDFSYESVRKDAA